MVYTHKETGKEISATDYADLSTAAQAKYQVKTENKTAKSGELYGDQLAAWFTQKKSEGSLLGGPSVPESLAIEGLRGKAVLNRLTIKETPDGASTRFVAKTDDGLTVKGSISATNTPTRFPSKGDRFDFEVRSYVAVNGETRFVADMIETTV